MNILVLGGGGREHAIIKKIKQQHKDAHIFALPGNAGMKEALCLPFDLMDKEAVLGAAKANDIDFCIVTPDDPLAIGMVDHLEHAGIICFGPREQAAQIEASKIFAKRFMDRHGIPSAAWREFSDSAEAIAYIKTQSMPIVIKADGLAKGKGVVVAKDLPEAEQAVKDMLDKRKFGESGASIIVEECLSGQEVSVLCLVDGEKIVPLLSAMDHKRALDGDGGENTGGMGVIAPNPFYTKEIAAYCEREVFAKTMQGFQKDGIVFKGCLFVGLMLDKTGPKVLEYNARFGDPETQAVLSLFEGDLLSCLLACAKGNLDPKEVRFAKGAAATIVLASKGYPGKFETGYAIDILIGMRGILHMAGVKEANGRLLSAGGRVLCVTQTGENLQEAIRKAYEAVKKVHFSNMYYRKDIGQKALLAEGETNGI